MTVEAIPPRRRQQLLEILPAIAAAQRVVLTTHVNADGDGSGSEAALAAWLAARGAAVHIINPTPFPDAYRFLVHAQDIILDPGNGAIDDSIAASDLAIVLDVSEPRRIGRLANALRDRTVITIDHHLPSDDRLPGRLVQDASACATGELVHDLLMLHDARAEWPAAVADGLYAAIVTDTGSFRFSNTTPRTHALAADLLRRGVDPETMFRRIYATVPLKRIQLLRAALERLEVDADHGIAWITIPRRLMAEQGATSEDMEGLIEHARSIEGTEVALLFRELSDGGTKISLRSSGAVDVNAIARAFGGGGHVKASGALVATPLDETRTQVVAAVRTAIRQLERNAHAG